MSFYGHHFITPIVVMAFPLLLTQCQTSSSTQARATPTEVAQAPRAQVSEDYIYRPAIVETVKSQILPTRPPEAVVTVSGLLQDGATNLHEVKNTRITGGFLISITTSRAKSAIATLALVPYERTITLDLSGMPSGLCQINVNGVISTLQVP